MGLESTTIAEKVQGDEDKGSGGLEHSTGPRHGTAKGWAETGVRSGKSRQVQVQVQGEDGEKARGQGRFAYLNGDVLVGLCAVGELDLAKGAAADGLLEDVRADGAVERARRAGQRTRRRH